MAIGLLAMSAALAMCSQFESIMSIAGSTSNGVIRIVAVRGFWQEERFKAACSILCATYETHNMLLAARIEQMDTP